MIQGLGAIGGTKQLQWTPRYKAIHIRTSARWPAANGEASPSRRSPLLVSSHHNLVKNHPPVGSIWGRPSILLVKSDQPHIQSAKAQNSGNKFGPPRVKIRAMPRENQSPTIAQIISAQTSATIHEKQSEPTSFSKYLKILNKAAPSNEIPINKLQTASP